LATVEGRGFLLRDLLHQAIQLAGAGLVEARLLGQAQDADGLEQPQRADAVGVGRVFGLLEADGHVAHRAQVVDLVGLHLLHDADQVGAVGEVAEMQLEALVVDMRVLVEVVDAVGVEQRRTALDTVDFVAFAQQQFGEVGAVLSGDAGDECGLGH
jgi:hypothetical protein